jgi:hypothetical protein
MRNIILLIIGALLTTGCGAPKVAPLASDKPVLIGDPLFSQDAPKLILSTDPDSSRIKAAGPHPLVLYPPDLRVAGIQGDVVVEVWINDLGIPSKAVALWGPKYLWNTAEGYLKMCKFQPFLVDGKPTPVRFRRVMVYRVDRGQEPQVLPKGSVY